MRVGEIPTMWSERLRDWGVTLWVGLALAAWLALVGVAEILEHAGHPVPTCVFKQVTGRPCAFCGSTRAVRAVLTGNVLDAIAWNPLFVALLTLGIGAVVVRLVRGPSTRRWPQGVVVGVLIAAVAANWAYVIWRGN